MNRLASQPDLGIGIGIAVGTTALSGVVLAIGATWLQWLGIASLLLLGEGILLAVVGIRGPGVPRSRDWIPMTPADLYAYEEERRQQQQEQADEKQTHPQAEDTGSRHWLRMALPPLILGVILVVLSSTV